MAESEKKQYNLRSTKDTVHVPASIQMQNDSQFVQNLLHQNQHDSDSDSAESELNCSAVADDSDSDHSTNKQTHTMPSTSSTSVSTSATGIDSALQQQINVQILSQLSAINDRLHAIESTNSKKTSDPKKIKKSKQKVSSQVNTSVTLPPPQTTNTTLPDLHAIRQDHLLQKQVEDRLKQLASADATGTKIKSLRGGPVEVVAISLTVRDGAISSKFSTHMLSKECNLCNFQKNFPSPKMAAILNFRIFAQNGKTRICFYLLNRAR